MIRRFKNGFLRLNIGREKAIARRERWILLQELRGMLVYRRGMGGIAVDDSLRRLWHRLLYIIIHQYILFLSFPGLNHFRRGLHRTIREVIEVRLLKRTSTIVWKVSIIRYFLRVVIKTV